MPSHLPPFIHCLGLPIILASVALASMVHTLYDVRDFDSVVPPWLRRRLLGRRRLGTGALPALTRLYLDENRVGDKAGGEGVCCRSHERLRGAPHNQGALCGRRRSFSACGFPAKLGVSRSAKIIAIVNPDHMRNHVKVVRLILYFAFDFCQIWPQLAYLNLAGLLQPSHAQTRYKSFISDGRRDSPA